MGDITDLLVRWRSGDTAAFEELTPLVYAELRDLAGHYMRGERANHTLQPTALVHEAYLRLIGVRRPRFDNRVHFYGAAAQAMRRILVDHARRRDAAKRGSGDVVVSLEEAQTTGITPDRNLIALDEALRQLESIAPRPAKVVELRYFGGLTTAEAAAFLDIAPATVKRHWSFARAWLHRSLTPS